MKYALTVVIVIILWLGHLDRVAFIRELNDSRTMYTEHIKQLQEDVQGVKEDVKFIRENLKR